MLVEIIADIRRRGDSSGWLKGTGGQESSGENESPPESISHDQAGDNDIVLSLLNEKYKVSGSWSFCNYRIRGFLLIFLFPHNFNFAGYHVASLQDTRETPEGGMW